MKKFFIFSILSFLMSFLILVLTAVFAAAAEAFDGVEGGTVFTVSLHGIPVWTFMLFFFVLGLALLVKGLKERKKSR